MAGTLRFGIVVGLALWGSAVPALAQRPAAAPHSPAVLEIASEPQGLVAEPGAIRRAAIFADRHLSGGERGIGFYGELNLIPGSGWIGAGPGYRLWLAQDRVLFDTSAAISWRGYKTAQARIEFPKLARSRILLGSQIRWQDFTQVNFYGPGPDAPESNRSEYRSRSTDVVGYGTLRPLEWIGISASLGWLTPSILPRGGTFMREIPDTRQLFADNPVFGIPDQPAYLHSEASITADTRDFPGHATRGGLARAAAGNYSDRDTGVLSFKRYEAEVAQFIPLAGSRVVLAVHGWLVASDTDDRQHVPFYLQPSLGGSNTLRGYADYRFHDRHSLVLNVEARIALMTHLDAAFLIDAGNVAARVHELDLDHRSYGAGLRLHTRRQTFARLDAARGSEGWRVMFSLSDPLTLSRVARRTASAPFVP